MSRALSRNLYLIGIGVMIVGFILLGVSFIGSTPSTETSSGSIGNPALFGISLFLVFAASIPMIVAWIVALVKLAQLSRWGWFVCMFFFSGITMLIYIFAGPDTPATPQGVQGVPYVQQPYPQQPYGQGQQQYPQSSQYPQQQYGQQYQQQSYEQPQQSYGQYPDQPPPNRG